MRGGGARCCKQTSFEVKERDAAANLPMKKRPGSLAIPFFWFIFLKKNYLKNVFYSYILKYILKFLKNVKKNNLMSILQKKTKEKKRKV